MSNPKRAEVEIELGTHTYTIKPTFQVMCEIEDSTGCGIIELGERMTRMQFGIQDVTKILYPPLKDQKNQDTGKPWTYEDLGQALLEKGFPLVAGPLSQFFAFSLGYDPDTPANGAGKRPTKKRSRRGKR